MKIAVIDDDVNILESLVEVLSQMGLEPLPFNCPKLALSVLNKIEVHLVLVDYGMQEMTGPQFIIELKKSRPFVECILLTANGYREVLIEAMKAGASDLVRKPFDLITLKSAIQAAIIRLKCIPTLADLEKRMIMKALAVCKTDKDAAEKLGINYTTLYRKKKTAA